MAILCKTPKMRMFSQVFATKCPSDHFTKGLQFKNNPIKKINTVRFTTFFQKSVGVPFSNLGITKAMALPTANKKKGKTKSVGVHPCQLACAKGLNICPQEPGLFTRIIKATVAPLKTSNA